MTKPPINTRVVEHCLWMAQQDPGYALKAAKWYGHLLEDETLVQQVQERMPVLTSSPNNPSK